MDTRNTSGPLAWLSLAKKRFKPKTIDVMVATTSPLMQDSRELPSSGSTYRYDVRTYVHAASCTKHVIQVIQYVFTRWR